MQHFPRTGGLGHGGKLGRDGVQVIAGWRHGVGRAGGGRSVLGSGHIQHDVGGGKRVFQFRHGSGGIMREGTHTVGIGGTVPLFGQRGVLLGHKQLQCLQGRVADSIVDNGFDLLLFTSSGGSQAMLDPFAFYIRHMSRLPVENVLSANLMTGDCNRITDKTVAFLTSKSGDTAETVKAANWLKEQGVRLFAAVGKENSTLESICDDTIVYGEGRPQELVFYLLIGRILYRSGNFDAYPRFADELKNLAFALAQVRKQADAKCLKYAQDYCKEPYNIWIGSGDLWPTAYSYSMCVLEESQWIRTKSVSSPEFFHGTLELLEDDVCTTLLLTEGPTRAQDERVKAFAARHTKKLTCFDTKEYALPGISDEFRPLLSPVVMAAVLQRISKNIEVITDHSLDIRRYYRKESY